MYMNNHPRIIEFVGLAGTGKSTLLNALRQQNQEIRDFIPPPKIGLILFMIQKVNLWLPLLLKQSRSTRQFDLADMWSMYCLDKWLYYLSMQSSNGIYTVVLDPGSVFWLTRLEIFGTSDDSRPAFQYWWKDKLEQWSYVLDMIIWLDAPEELCLERVLGRNQWHPAKLENQQEVLNRFRQLRSGYGQTLSKMSSWHPKKIFFFRTDQQSTAQITQQILTEIAITSPKAEAIN